MSVRSCWVGKEHLDFVIQKNATFFKVVRKGSPVSLLCGYSVMQIVRRGVKGGVAGRLRELSWCTVSNTLSVGSFGRFRPFEMALKSIRNQPAGRTSYQVANKPNDLAIKQLSTNPPSIRQTNLRRVSDGFRLKQFDVLLPFSRILHFLVFAMKDERMNILLQLPM